MKTVSQFCLILDTCMGDTCQNLKLRLNIIIEFWKLNPTMHGQEILGEDILGTLND